ncbi:fatty-acyl-CoA synthase [Tistlia consotensis]|uniref:3-methylmercaptopropionyl-CoA ligase n=1 Tax=Tistlia consotensis USBA 355 TaxID=560819 RepID=A0A1Y6BBG2_9PROT|nr:long-chain fatty acid--CoA ligase [Tistlia consotensis]SME92116.1 fatty-acyl-CoA synthase [Tistlia consotensis USBA 355]SNR27832.1 fatty-acyl-CoA synthase [Tistlia consotensis]
MFSLLDIAAKRAELSPDKTALEELVSGARISYRELDRRACRFAAALRGLGLAEGERIAILSHNRAAFFEILFACAKARVVLVPLNWRQTVAELAPLLDDCRPRLLLHDAPCAALAEALGQARPGLSLLAVEEEGTGPRPGSYQALRDKAEERRDWDPVWPAEGLWYLLYTSGTTGRPKAVMQTFGMAHANFVNLASAIDLTAGDVTPNYLPLFHTAGINLHSLPTLIAGGTVKVLPGFDAERFLDLIESGGVTALLAVPAIYHALAALPRFAAADLSKVRSWSSGGAPLPATISALYAARGVTLCPGYGMTETGPTTFLTRPEEALCKPGSVGRPLLMTQCRIVGPDGRDLPPGEAGELLLRGANVTPGYWNRPDATAETIDRAGWLRSGDIARADAEGFVFIVDRIKDMYISGGENVYPAEVEAALLGHPEVAEVAVVGIADERWGEVGRAYVVPRPGGSPDEAGLRAWCRERLAGYKVPKSVVLVEALPRTPAGKVQKHLLRARGTEPARQEAPV